MILVLWTWNKHRQVRTQKDATHCLRVWKRWYERCGWTVKGNQTRGYRAFPPGWDDEPEEYRGVAANHVGRVHAIAIRTL